MAPFGYQPYLCLHISMDDVLYVPHIHLVNGPITGHHAVPGAKPDCSTWILSGVPIYAESTQVVTMDGLTSHGTWVRQDRQVTKFPAWHLGSRPRPELLGVLNCVDPKLTRTKRHRACSAVWTWKILACQLLSVVKSQESFLSANINGGTESAWDLCQSLVSLSLSPILFSQFINK